MASTSPSHSVDYNTDFKRWPPSAQAIAILENMFGPVTLYAPDEHGVGYAQFQVLSQVTYERVTSVQRKATLAMHEFGGVCESWGVAQDAPQLFVQADR